MTLYVKKVLAAIGGGLVGLAAWVVMLLGVRIGILPSSDIWDLILLLVFPGFGIYMGWKLPKKSKKPAP